SHEGCLALLHANQWNQDMVDAWMALVKDPDQRVRQFVAMSIFLDEDSRIPQIAAASKALLPPLLALRKDPVNLSPEAAMAIDMLEGSVAMKGGFRLAKLRRTVGPKEKPVWCDNTL